MTPTPQARALAEAATEGPWTVEGEEEDDGTITFIDSPGMSVATVDCPADMRGPNGAFIAASRTLVPELCDRIEALEKAIADEEECPGKMPDEMWAIVSKDRDACEEMVRIAVRQTKAWILARAALSGEKKV